MKLAIHNGLGWNQRWAEYCTEKNIPFILVDCCSSDIISVLRDNEVTHLMWHFSHSLPKDIFLARNVLFSAQKMGIKVFPDFNTSWHFDDKVSQKYLLESIGAPLVPSHTFVDKGEALEWLSKSASFPLVAKLRRGAGSYNVRLIKNYKEAKKYIKAMFGRGIKPTPGYLADGKNKLRVAGNLKGILNRLKRAPNFFRMIQSGRLFPKEKGYVYFQDFIPDNDCDYRIKVVGDICWGFKRMVRKGDFRASGSGMLVFDLDIPQEMIFIAFDIAKKIGMQSVAFDFVLDGAKPLIVEISYCFGIDPGESEKYWKQEDGEIVLYNESFNPVSDILDSFIK